MNISKISPENFTGNDLKLSCYLTGEKENKAIYRRIDVNNIKSVDLEGKTGYINLKNDDWFFISLKDPKNKKDSGYNVQDVLAAINTAKNGIDVTI